MLYCSNNAIISRFSMSFHKKWPRWIKGNCSWTSLIKILKIFILPWQPSKNFTKFFTCLCFSFIQGSHTIFKSKFHDFSMTFVTLFYKWYLHLQNGNSFITNSCCCDWTLPNLLLCCGSVASQNQTNIAININQLPTLSNTAT